MVRKGTMKERPPLLYHILWLQSFESSWLILAASLALL